MGYGPIINGRQHPITRYENSWAARANDPIPQHVKDHHAGPKPLVIGRVKADGTFVPAPTHRTYLIVPAVTDQGGQCRIVARDHAKQQPFAPSALAQYRDNPDDWKEVGLMNSRGRLVCLQAHRLVHEELADCAPLAAGMTFTFNLDCLREL